MTKQSMTRNYKKVLEPKWILVGMFFVSGIFLGVLGLYLFVGKPASIIKLHSPTSEYTYINPLLGVELQSNSLFPLDKSFSLIIQSIINTEKDRKNITNASVYFRDLDSSEWAGINEDAKFTPGKLLKLPIMIAYYKMAEVTPDLLFRKLRNTYGAATTTSFFPSKTQLVLGEEYTVDDIIRQMIINSDDNAARLLFDNIDRRILNEVFSDLGIDFVEDKDTPDYISLKLNSLFLRVLYNATYLNREFSEKALTLLDEVNDNTGISAGLPRGTSVSRRFGGNTTIKNGLWDYDIYDCGIVYYPGHPYILCASANGEKITGVETFFKNLSEKVYTEMKYKYKG